MAIRQIGGQPVYVVEVDVPKVTDARGRSYGTLVSDLRWKLWEEVQNSQLQQMKFEQMSKQAQLDVLEQKQRDISRAIRDANEHKSQIKAETTKGTAPARGYQEKTRKPAISPYTGKPTGEFLETTRTRTPFGDTAGTAATAESKADVQVRRDELDEYIATLEKQQSELGQEFGRFSAQPGPDILSRTRDAFQTQIGEGGFGISRRPLRQLPRFDEAKSVGLLQDTLVREEQALLDEAIKRKADRATQAKMRIEEIQALGQEDETSQALLLNLIPQAVDTGISLDEERQIRELARRRLAEGMTAAGAEPTSRAGFLMKDFPQGSALLPREETRFPTGRIRDDFGVEGRTALNREQEILRDINFSDSAKYVDELFDEYQVRRATERGDVPESPLEYSIRRNIEFKAMGEPPAYKPPAYELPKPVTDAVIRAGQEQLDTSRLPRDRGFDTPVEQMGQGFGATTTFGRPGGVLDRLNIRTRKNVGGTAEIVDPDTGAPIDPTQPQTSAPIDPTQPQTSAPAPAQSQPQTSGEATPVGGRIPLGDGVMYDPLDRVIYGKEGFPIFRESQEPNPNSAAPYQPQIVTPQELQNKVKEIKEAGGYEPPQAKNTIPQRRERYAMKTIKQGLELSEKPKQLARLAKTNDPSKAPEYVQLVNKIFELNSTKPDRFKLSFDEIARAYKDDSSTREKAHSYLVAIDAVESNITKPT